MNRHLFTAAITAAIVVAGFSAHGEVSERESLKDIEGFMVIVERLHEDAEQFGLDRTQIVEDVESRLRRAGINVLTTEEREQHSRKPYLYLNINILYVSDIGLVTFSLDLEAHQNVTLKNGDEAQALTWAKSYLGVLGTKNAAEGIREIAAEHVDTFVREWVLVNRPPELVRERTRG